MATLKSKEVQVMVVVEVQAGATDVATAYSVVLSLAAAGMNVKSAFPVHPVPFDDEGDYA